MYWIYGTSLSSRQVPYLELDLGKHRFIQVYSHIDEWYGHFSQVICVKKSCRLGWPTKTAGNCTYLAL